MQYSSVSLDSASVVAQVPANLSGVASIGKNVVSSFTWMGQKCRRFTRLASQGLLLALDGLFFAGKVTDSIPKAITNASLILLSCIPFISMPYSIDYIRKSVKDATFGYRSDNKAVFIIAAAKAIELISTIGLATGGIAGSIEGMAGYDQAQALTYRWMTPWGIATIALSMGTTLAYMYMNHQALKLLTSEGIEQYAYPVIAAFHEESGDIPQEVNPGVIPNKFLASQIRLCMDKDTLEELLENLKKIPAEDSETRKRLMQIVEDNIQTQQKINLGGQLILFLVGDVLMVVQKYFTPNSLVSASISFGMGGLYTIKIGAETFKEIWQRKRITHAVSNRTDVELKNLRSSDNTIDDDNAMSGFEKSIREKNEN